MWNQLTQKARKAIFLAQEEAGKLGYSHVGTEHILLAILREDDCLASQILMRLGLDLGTVRVKIMDRLTRGGESLADDMQLGEDAKMAIDFAFDEGRRLKDDWIGTEHLLIGLARCTGSTACETLVALGADAERVRKELKAIHAGTLPLGHSLVAEQDASASSM